MISAAAYLVLVIASSPRGEPQPPTGMASKDSTGAEIRHTASRRRQEPLLSAPFAGVSRPRVRNKMFISGHVKKAWSIYGSTITASLPFAM